MVATAELECETVHLAVLPRLHFDSTLNPYSSGIPICDLGYGLLRVAVSTRDQCHQICALVVVVSSALQLVDGGLLLVILAAVELLERN